MIEFDTATGSTYQIDPAISGARRTSATERSGKTRLSDGTWRKFAHLTPGHPEIGSPVIFFWDLGQPDVTMPVTITSRVVEVRGAAS